METLQEDIVSVGDSVGLFYYEINSTLDFTGESVSVGDSVVLI